jgi:streptomycin 6-kinase
VELTVPAKLASVCAAEPELAEWLERLPTAVARLRDAWSLELGPAFDHEGFASWVAPVTRADGSSAVLKLGVPHMEAEHEAEGLRFWDGDGAVRLLDENRELDALLLERCEPGTTLRELPEAEQDVVLAALLRRLWRPVPEEHPFRPLATMTAAWAAERLGRTSPRPDPGIFREGLRLFEELPRSATTRVVLATDLHAGNVLRAEREPWLAIDPKPFVGDPAYDATQHMLNCERLLTSPLRTVDRFADLLELDRERVRAWTFARIVMESGVEWADRLLPAARALTH